MCVCVWRTASPPEVHNADNDADPGRTHALHGGHMATTCAADCTQLSAPSNPHTAPHSHTWRPRVPRTPTLRIQQPPHSPHIQRQCKGTWSSNNATPQPSRGDSRALPTPRAWTDEGWRSALRELPAVSPVGTGGWGGEGGTTPPVVPTTTNGALPAARATTPSPGSQR